MEKNTDEKIKENIVECYDKYYRLAYSYAHNEQDALDIVQEGAYKAIRYSKSLSKEEFISTWVYRIMINESLQFLKKNKSGDPLIDDLVQGREDNYENIDLKRAIEELEEPEGTIIKLRFFEDMKIEQIAVLLNENINTIKSKLYRSLKVLKLSLGTEETV